MIINTEIRMLLGKIKTHHRAWASLPSSTHRRGWARDSGLNKDLDKMRIFKVLVLPEDLIYPGPGFEWDVNIQNQSARFTRVLLVLSSLFHVAGHLGRSLSLKGGLQVFWVR